MRATDEAANTDPSPALSNFTVDTTPPFLKLSAKRPQQLGKPIEVKMSCAEDCAVLAAGKIVVSRASRGRSAARNPRASQPSFGLRRVAKQLSGKRSATFALQTKRWGAQRWLRWLVTDGDRASARFELTATDRAGNETTAKLKVALREP